MKWRLLDGLPEEEVRSLLSGARRRSFARHEVVFHRDDPADSLHLVVRGRFAVQVMTRLGETMTLSILGPGDHFGELALLTPRGCRSATVEALEEAETFCVYQDDFERLRARHRSIDAALMASLVGEVRLLSERVLEAVYTPVKRRLLRRVSELSLVYGGDDREQHGEVRLPLTQEELAQLAGTSRATVNEILRAEEKRGTLELRRGATIIRERDALNRATGLSW